jgi:hypothetical protein
MAPTAIDGGRVFPVTSVSDWCGMWVEGTMPTNAKNVGYDTLILNRFRDGSLTSPFTVRDIHRKGWSGLSNRVRIEATLNAMAEVGFVTRREMETGGRPTAEYTINKGTF